MADDEESSVTARCIWQVYHVPIILGCFSLLFIVLSITIFIKSYQQTSPITFSSDESEATVAGSVARVAETILVDIEGAIVLPGIYRLPFGSRVDDALGAAGGFTKDADTEAIARSINRAAKLADGAKIYIPAIGQDQASDEAHLSAGIAAFININTASQSELESLTGIGLVTAGKIISGRPFLRLEELVEKKAMSQSLFDKLKDQLTL